MHCYPSLELFWLVEAVLMRESLNLFGNKLRFPVFRIAPNILTKSSGISAIAWRVPFQKTIPKILSRLTRRLKSFGIVLEGKKSPFYKGRNMVRFYEEIRKSSKNYHQTNMGF